MPILPPCEACSFYQMFAASGSCALWTTAFIDFFPRGAFYFLDCLSQKFCAAYLGCHSPTGPRSSSSLRPCLSLVNELRRCTRVQGSTVRTQISMAQGEKARGVVDSGFSGSPSFVAVVQSTDLR